MATNALETTPAKSWRALSILFVLGIFNYLDRTLLGILQIPIQKELGLSDTQLGLLLGVSFAVVYTTFGLPIGRLADRTSRRKVLAFCLFIWTGLTALTGLATNFLTLLLCRMGVAFGEASCAPITHSLISDYFPKKRRGTAVALWAVSLPIGVILGFLLGGWLSSALGWRRAFIDVGLIGMIMVPIVFFLLHDPKRGAFEAEGAVDEEVPPLKSILRLIWQTKSYRYILIAASLHLFSLHAVQIWVPQFYARVFQLPVQQVGMTMALIAGGGGLIGMFLGGYLVDRMSLRDQRWYVWLPALSAALLLPISLIQYWTNSLPVSIGAGLIVGALFQLFFAPMIAVTQSLMPPRVRTFTGAFYVFFVNIFSMSLGPLFTGVLSDVFGADPSIGSESLRLSLTLVQVGCLFAIGVFVIAGKTLRQDLARIDRGEKLFN